ncbi:MAG: PhoH family protein [Deltaproteobacteria bacterium]|nr:MAG: PhoH family protein [Deltaproteobacteria bacterium]
MRKNFVLDTNVLLHDPNALFAFKDNDVVVPIYVIEEIDRFKRDMSELGRNARVVGRYIDNYRKEGKLGEGVPLPGGGTLRVLFARKDIPIEIGLAQKMDHKILAVALELKNTEPEKQTVFITKDVNLRIKADVLDIRAEDYDTERVSIDEIYTGVKEVEVDAALIDRFYTEGGLDVDEVSGLESEPNMFVHLADSMDNSHTALARISPDGRRLQALRKPKGGLWGIHPRNREQVFAVDILLDDRIKLVTLAGKAGTGKTLLAIAAGLYKTAEENTYQRLLVSRPIFPMGRDIGYLPGDVEDKLNPWMQPIFDNMDFLLNVGGREKRRGRSYRELMDMDMVEIEPLTYIRGRSIPNQFIVVDEAQNLTPHEVKTIITRAGDSTKIVLTGDLYQIDNPYVDASNNGLSYIVNRFRGKHIAAHVTLVKGERSELAELASDVL